MTRPVRRLRSACPASAQPAHRSFAAARAAGRYCRSRWPLLLFVGLLTAYRATQWGLFAVPAPDFFDFEDTAQALASGRLPDQFQRAPLYPALIAILSPLIGGARPALAAAQAINLILSASALILMYEVCARLVGRWALLVVMLSGLHWTMAYVTVHPLCEPALLAATLAALHLDLSGRKGKYLAAGLAVAARYEGLFLIAALAACDLARRRRPFRVATAAALAAAPAVAWVTIGALRGGANPYAAVVAAQTPAGLEFLRSLAMSAIGAMPVQVLEGALAGSAASHAAAAAAFAATGVLMVLGVRRLAGLYPRAAAPLLSFGGAYVIVHLLYPAANTRFALPVLWLVHLLAVMGALDIAQWVRSARPVGRRWRRAAVAALAAAAAAVTPWAARSDPLWVVPLSAPIAWAVAGGRNRPGAAAVLCALPFIALPAAGALGLSSWYLDRESRWWAELQPVARWCEQRRPGPVCLAATRPAWTLVSELCHHPRVRFYDLSRLERSAREKNPAELPAAVTHLLWCATDTPPAGERLQSLLSHRYADERERSMPTGRRYARGVADGSIPGWRVCARFVTRGQRAVIYMRDDTRQARAGMEARR